MRACDAVPCLRAVHDLGEHYLSMLTADNAPPAVALGSASVPQSNDYDGRCPSVRRDDAKPPIRKFRKWTWNAAMRVPTAAAGSV